MVTHRPMTFLRAEGAPEQGPAGGPTSRPTRAARVMPDIAEGARAHTPGTLDRVGMSHIEVPVQLVGADGLVRMVPAVADAYVSLDDPEAKGIHMSRLFLGLQARLESGPLSVELLDEVLIGFLDSHADLSESAHVRLRFDWMIKRPALVSSYKGWRTYPVEVSAWRAGGETRFRVGTTVTYSSTCPCSAALARQLIQEQFDADFGKRGSVEIPEVRAWLGTEAAIRATPHSQRSQALVTVELGDRAEGLDGLDIEGLVDRVEDALQTAVQAAVKREDEQEFALRNGQNLMFCEDAGRRVQAALEADPRVTDYRVECRHQESLHPHDAVSITTKGVPGGLTA